MNDDRMHQNIFADLSILWISRYDYLDGWVLDPHYHDGYHQLIYCISGEGMAYSNGNRHKLVSHTVQLINPGVIHSIDSVAKCGLQTLDIKFIINNDDLIRKLEAMPAFINADDDSFRNLLERIRIEGDRRQYEYMSYCQLLLGELLVELLRTKTAAETKIDRPVNFYYKENVSEIGNRIMNYISDHYTERLTSSDFARELNFSYRYLSRILINDIGMSPIEYLEYYRCNTACEMLSVMNYGLKEIAEKVGYPSVHQFSKSFKRVIKMSPGMYRNTAQLGVRRDINFNKEFVNGNNDFHVE